MEKTFEDRDKDNYSDAPIFDEISLIECFIETYKNAFSGFWHRIGEILEKYPVDDAILFSYADIYFMLAWSYSKCKDYIQEEFYYRKCMELNPNMKFVVNNLGYCLYMQKRYSEAKELFESCLKKRVDLPCVANNYVRVLIALGRNKDAKDFVQKGDFKISKDIVKRVKKLDNTNDSFKKSDMVQYDLEDTESVEEIKVDMGVKRYQFTSERILEDELTARLEKGIPVFGMNLHIYNCKGDYYGRQYPFPLGRLDLLCEDKAGNLYIIELKKDGGYDDAYKQISDYLDWFQKADISKGKKSIWNYLFEFAIKGVN